MIGDTCSSVGSELSSSSDVNEIVRGWVNYFRVGNASQAFAKVRYNVELKVRRFATRQRKRSGFG